MKKLFSALAAVLMIGTSATTIVACRKPVYDIEILLVPSKDPLEIESQLYTLNKQFQKVFSEVSGSNKRVGFKVSPDYNIASFVLRAGQAALGMVPVTTYYQKDIKESKGPEDRKLGTLFLSTRTAVKTELRAYGQLDGSKEASLKELKDLQDKMNAGGNEQDLSKDIANEFMIAQESNKAYAQDANNIYYTEKDKEANIENPIENPIVSATHYRSIIFANKQYAKDRRTKVLNSSWTYSSRFSSSFKSGTFTTQIIKDAYSKMDDELNFINPSSPETLDAHSVILLDMFTDSMENANTSNAKVGMASSATSGSGMVKPVETLLNNYIVQQGLVYSEESLQKAKDFAIKVLAGYKKSGGYATELPNDVKDGALNIGVAFNDGRVELQLKKPGEDYLKNTWMLSTSSGIMNDGMLYSKSFFRRNNIAKPPNEEVLENPNGETMESTGNNLLDAIRKSFLELMDNESGLSVMRKIYSHEGYTPLKFTDYQKGDTEYDQSVKEAQTSPLNKLASEVALAINK